jgi:hypothetical protein
LGLRLVLSHECPAGRAAFLQDEHGVDVDVDVFERRWASEMTPEYSQGYGPLILLSTLTLDTLRQAVAVVASSRLLGFLHEIRNAFSQAGKEDSVFAIRHSTVSPQDAASVAQHIQTLRRGGFWCDALTAVRIAPDELRADPLVRVQAGKLLGLPRSLHCVSGHEEIPLGGHHPSDRAQ